MAALTLKINVVDLNLVKTMTFDAKSSVHSACEQINKKLQDTSIHKQFKRKYSLRLVAALLTAFLAVLPVALLAALLTADYEMIEIGRESRLETVV